MRRKKIVIIVAIATFVVLISSILIFLLKGKSFEENVKEVVSKYVGRAVMLPDSADVLILDKELRLAIPKTKYKLLTIVDSKGCVSCKMQLLEWQSFMTMLQSGMEFPDDISLIFVAESKPSPELFATIKGYDFRYPIVIDTTGYIRKQNKLPEDPEFSTFLIDKNNKIVALGNPIMFKKIGLLYSRIVGSNGSDSQVKEALSVPKMVSLGAISNMKPIRTRITLVNTTDSICRIEKVESSCPCITTYYKYPSIRPKGETDMILTYQPNEETATESAIISRSLYVYLTGVEEPIELEVYGYNNLKKRGIER